MHVNDASLAGQIMAGLLVEPVTRTHGWVADAGGRAFTGTIIEWLARRAPDGSQPAPRTGRSGRQPPRADPWRGRQLPVPSLAVQLAVAERRGLADRAALIRQDAPLNRWVNNRIKRSLQSQHPRMTRVIWLWPRIPATGSCLITGTGGGPRPTSRRESDQPQGLIWRSASFTGGFILLDDAGRDAAALAQLNSLGFGPGPDVPAVLPVC